MIHTTLKSRNRLFALGVLLILSFAAAGRNVAQEADKPAPWPKEVDSVGTKITIYEPQLESLKGSKLSSRAAVSVIPAGSTEPVFGALWLETTLSIDAEHRTGKAESVQITEMRFPTGDAGRLPGLREALAKEVSSWKTAYSMDTILTELRQVEERKAAAQALKAEVPEINFRSHPAVMLVIDGDPEWRALPGSPLKRLANSTFFVVEEANAGKCYLRISPFWWTAASALGPWQAAADVPESVEELWTNEPKPQVADDDDREDNPRRPEVLVSTRPAELIWTDGLPQYAPIGGTDLLYVKNTSSDVFLEISTQTSYVLLSGRWFRTASTKVAWEHVPSDLLPLDFTRIPLGSEKQHVLACVAGTAQARDAVKNAEIPQTEAVKPGPAPNLSATYDGEPQFTQIADSQVQYAANSPSPIFYVDRRYYWCEDGIWYDSDYAVGPWYVCTYVPRPIYLIPPSCPFYYVTYCRIFSVSPWAVTCGYYPGYRGCYVWGNTIVYGTGYRYRPWSGSYCYIRPATWGVGVRYNYGACSWTFGLGWGSSSAWGGVRTYRRTSTIAVGVGGGTNVRIGAGYRNSVGVDVAVPVRPNRPDNLYVRQPSRILRTVPQEPPPSTVTRPGVPRRDPTPAVQPPARPDSGARSREIPRDVTRPKDEDRDARDLRPREIPRPKDPDPRDNARSREIPRTPPGADRQPPKPPPPVERRTPPPVERREPPRNPPPVERREPPRTPPPPPPPREERRAPPPPPPPVERRAPPRSPPPPREERRAPPPIERRDPPRSPPPQERQRDSDRGSDRRR